MTVRLESLTYFIQPVFAGHELVFFHGRNARTSGNLGNAHRSCTTERVGHVEAPRDPLAVRPGAHRPRPARPACGDRRQECSDRRRAAGGARLRLGNSGVGLGEPAVGGAISLDAKYLALASRAEITLFERQTGKPLAKIAGAPGLPLVAVSPDGKVLAYGDGMNILLAELPSGAMLRTLEVPEGDLMRGRNLTFSADGKVIAVGEDRAKGMPRAFAWDVATGKSLGTFPVLYNASCATALAPDGKRLATWGRHVVRMIGEDDEPSKIVQLWDVATGKELRKLKLDRANIQINAVAISADGKTVAVASGMSTFHLFDAETGQELRRFAGRRGATNVLQYSPDGKLLVAGSYEGGIQAWHTADGKRLDLQPGPPRSRLLSVAFPGDGQIVALGLIGQSALWWDAVTGKTATSSTGHATPVLALAYAPDGRSLTTASFDGAVLSWDTTTGTVLHRLSLVDTVGMRLTTLALSPDAHYAATGSIYNGVRLWDLRTGQVACDFEPTKPSGAFGVAFAPRSDRLAAASLMQLVNVWNVESGEEAGKAAFDVSANTQAGGTPRVAFAPDGKTLAVAVSSFDGNTGQPWGRVLLLDAATGKERLALDAPGVSVGGAAFAGGPMLGASVAFSPDGKLLALPGPNQSVVVVRADTGKEAKKLEMPGGFAAITALAFSPDGRTLAIAHGGQRIIGPMGDAGSTPPMLELWELAGGQRRTLYRGQQGGINCLAFAPDGLTLASGSTDTTVMLWDVTGMFGQKPVVLAAPELEAEWAHLAKVDGEAAFRAAAPDRVGRDGSISGETAPPGPDGDGRRKAARAVGGEP